MTRTPYKSLKLAIEMRGGQAALARDLGVVASHVRYYLRTRKPVPPLWAQKIESVTGGAISKSELRKDIWPNDLVQAQRS